MRRRGLTLIEVIAALSILMVMSVLTWESISGSFQVRQALMERDETTRAARVAMGRLRRELQLAFLSKYPSAIETYSTLFVGLDDNPDQLYFTSLSHQRLYRDSRECDQTEITIWAESAPNRGEGYILYHREAPRIDEEPDEDGVIYPLAYNLRSFSLRYLDPTINEWVDEWDTRKTDTANRLPRAIQIGLILIGQDPEDKDRTREFPFLTTVRLEYADQLQRSLFAKDGG